MVETELADSGPERRPGPWKLIVIVAVLTVVGVWLVPGDAPEDDPKMPGSAPRDATQQGAGPDAPPSLLAEGPPGGLPAEATSGGLEAVDDRPGAKARALIARLRAAGDIQLDAVFAAAEQAQTAGEMADAYLLYFFAAREGHAPSALALGMQADPASRDPANSVFAAPDLNQAHKWFQIAAEAGDAEGRTRLADLRTRVDKLAAGGDPQAQRISLLWQ